jgi:hypothetical protein
MASFIIENPRRGSGGLFLEMTVGAAPHDPEEG